MSNILVAYYSLTGNTQKVAAAIFASLPEPKTLKPIVEVQSLDEHDLVFIGFPVHSHSVPIQAEKFLRSIPKGKKIALFSTHGSHTGSRLSREAIEHAVVVSSQAKLISTFSCRGKVSPQALEVLSRSPEHEAWTEMAASARTHPNEHDLEDAGNFGSWVLTLSRHQGT
ncbi:MAG: flavodoxin family protein [Candidatus Aminicenantes bacterium]|nr:flavodoxin family protein [Candidatus Aminicenantes bacterium]